MSCFPGFFGPKGEDPSTVRVLQGWTGGIPLVMGSAEEVGAPLLGYWEGAGSRRAAAAAFCTLLTPLRLSAVILEQSLNQRGCTAMEAESRVERSKDFLVNTDDTV